MLQQVFDKQTGQVIYQGMSGTKYQYDLSNFIDKQKYAMDISAQMRDQTTVSLYRNTENGGGILYDETGRKI
ncbi:MAG: hypothetical protein IJV35_01060 [Neisseriaceae bacterium]|nr:hypothetical protein [Neisseriaceae bacterium]